MILAIRQDIIEQLVNVYRLEPNRVAIDSAFFIGGYSEERQRWETYTTRVHVPSRFSIPDVGELDDSLWFSHVPYADNESLSRHGFNVEVSDSEGFGLNATDAAIRFLRAIRATPQSMGEVGDDADTALTGSTIAGFIERVSVFRNQILSEIVWRWPDETGRMVDPAQEGQATSLYRHIIEDRNEASAA